jgi:hypothetical protein
MPTPKDYVVYRRTTAVDGQLPVSTVNSDWVQIEGVSKLLLMGNFVGGTTVVNIEQSHQGSVVDHTSADLLASLEGTGAEVNVGFKYARVHIVQSVATATTADLSVKTSD